MASDNTQAKAALWFAHTDDERATIPCPSCDRVMVATDDHRDMVVHGGRHPRTVAVATASHTVPASQGGTTVALECKPCNVDRGDNGWDAPADAPTVKAWKGSARRALAGRLAADGERWLAEG